TPPPPPLHLAAAGAVVSVDADRADRGRVAAAQLVPPGDPVGPAARVAAVAGVRAAAAGGGVRLAPVLAAHRPPPPPRRPRRAPRPPGSCGRRGRHSSRDRPRACRWGRGWGGTVPSAPRRAAP